MGLQITESLLVYATHSVQFLSLDFEGNTVLCHIGFEFALESSMINQQLL